MDVIEAISGRRTVPPLKMADEPLGEDEVAAILAAGAAAPDHGKMRPWRFITVCGEARGRLGEVFASAVLADDPDASDAEIEKQKVAPLRAPFLVIVTALLDPSLGKHPPVERIASAAAAVQNMLLAAHGLGLAAKWATGKNARSATVKRGLGVAESDEIVGILYIGRYAQAHPPTERPDHGQVVVDWRQPLG
jgi:nitroreductase